MAQPVSEGRTRGTGLVMLGSFIMVLSTALLLLWLPNLQRLLLMAISGIMMVMFHLGWSSRSVGAKITFYGFAGVILAAEVIAIWVFLLDAISIFYALATALGSFTLMKGAHDIHRTLFGIRSPEPFISP